MAVQVVVAAQEGVERLWEKQASTGMRTGSEAASCLHLFLSNLFSREEELVHALHG